MATSGTYERGDYIVDPRLHTTLDALLSVTVVGPSLARADAYATAACSLGGQAARWIASLPDYEGIVIAAGDRVIRTGGLDRYRDPG